MKRNRLSVIRSSDSDRMVILEQHSYPSVSSIHSPSPTSCPTRSRNHCTLSLTIYRFTVPRANRRFETRVFEQKGADGNQLDNERSGTAEKWTERKMDEKSRRTLSCYARNCSVHETMTFSTVFLSSAAISARS